MNKKEIVEKWEGKIKMFDSDSKGYKTVYVDDVKLILQRFVDDLKTLEDPPAVSIVILSRLDEEIEKISKEYSLLEWDSEDVILLLKNIKESAISHPKISGV